MRPRLEIGLLISLLLAALALRLWYGAFDPVPHRFWDERYTLDNIRPVYAEASLAPVSGDYPSPLVSVPPAVALWVAESASTVAGRSWDAIDDTTELFKPGAYIIMRWLQALYGVVGIALLFVIGRRLWSAEVGLLAAAFLAFMPWHIHASGYIKPDAQLVASVLLAFLAALAAIDRPTWGRYTMAGLAVSLAASAKLTGVLVAAALATGTLMLARRQPKRLLLAGLAGLVAFASFALTNPHWQSYRHLIRGLGRDYATRADEASRWQIPGKLVEQMLDGYGLGPFAGILALGGLAAWTYATATGRGALGARRVRFAMLLVFLAIYGVVYALQTSYYKGGNFLPVLPFAALAGSWTLVALAEQTQRPRTVISVAGCVLVILGALGATRYVYRSVTPSTFDHANSFLQRSLGRKIGRLVFVAGWREKAPPWDRRLRLGDGEALVHRLDRLDAVAPARLAMADAIVLPTSQLAKAAAEVGIILKQLMATAQVQHFSSKGMATRGPDLVAIAQRWQPLNTPGEMPVNDACPSAPRDPACRRVEAAEDQNQGEAWTFVIWPGVESQPVNATLDVGGRAVALDPTPKGYWLSDRVVALSSVEIRLPAGWSEMAQQTARIDRLRWQAPLPRRDSGN